MWDLIATLVTNRHTKKKGSKEGIVDGRRGELGLKSHEPEKKE